MRSVLGVEEEEEEAEAGMTTRKIPHLLSRERPHQLNGPAHGDQVQAHGVRRSVRSWMPGARRTKTEMAMRKRRRRGSPVTRVTETSEKTSHHVTAATGTSVEMSHPWNLLNAGALEVLGTTDLVGIVKTDLVVEEIGITDLVEEIVMID